MVTKSAIVYGMLIVGMMLPLAGCGDGNDNNDNSDIGGGTPTPRRTSTPGGPTAGGATATPEEATPTPGSTVAQPTITPTPTGGGPACQAGDQIVAMLSVDQPYGGLSLRLAYPPAANIPGSGTAQSVKDRVVFAHAGGLTAVNDLDNSGDGVDDTLAASSVASDENPSGLYLTVTFDCLAGQNQPAASDFACSVQSASMPDGTEITGENCTVTVQ